MSPSPSFAGGVAIGSIQHSSTEVGDGYDLYKYINIDGRHAPSAWNSPKEALNAELSDREELANGRRHSRGRPAAAKPSMRQSLSGPDL